jgi:hypothetical protein
MQLCRCIPLLLLLCVTADVIYAQDEPSAGFAARLLGQVNKKTAHIEEKLSRQTAHYLSNLEKQERKLKAKLQRKDSVAAKEIFGDVTGRYKNISNATGKANLYNGTLDSLQTALKFLDQNKFADKEKLQSVLGQYASLQEKFNQTEQVKKLLTERTHYLKEQLEKFGMVKEFRAYQKQLYYYRSQLNEYKQLLNDPTKLEAKLLALVNKLPAFRDFFNKHSALASMFRLPEINATSDPIAGLQTRASVQQLLESRFGTGPDVSKAMQQNMQSAQEQLNQLKEKITSLGENGGDLDLPGFKPNSYKTKSFWQRIELGTNFQSTRSNNFFPVTSDLGLSAGYKLNERSIIGVGASYKLGWGSGIRNIRLTNEGVGLRSFVDWRVKGSLYVSGGFEYNYQQPYGSFRQLYYNDNWQKSGLLGVSRIVSVQSKFFKKTKLQLLWDFLSYEQVPRTQPLKFRVGYTWR